MKTIILIPARYASSRYPGKPLAKLKMPNGSHKSLIQMSYEAACKVNGIDSVYVATDDNRIKEAARTFGAEVIMTSKHCRNGTERCSDAQSCAGLKADLFINLQGDAPLTPPWFIEELIIAMQTDENVAMATPVVQLNYETYNHFVRDRKNNRVGGTTAVFNNSKHALYFSKELLPFLDLRNFAASQNIPAYHHVGVYAYRPNILRDYKYWPEGRLEQLEGLEQLRFLENGHKIKCVEVDSRGRAFWELNNPEDIAVIEAALRQFT